MKVSEKTHNGKFFSEEWFLNLTQLSDLKHGTMFEAVFVKKNEDTDSKNKILPFGRRYIYFNGEYYQITKNGSAKVEKDDPIIIQNSLNTIMAYNVTEEDLKNPIDSYFKAIHEKIKEEEIKYQLKQEDIDIFKKYGINPQPVNGASSSLKRASSINYSGVHYAICFHNDDIIEKEESISRGVSHFEQVKKRHHEKVKSVYDFLIASDEVKHPVWVMMGGKAEIQAFFGNEDGYIAILYLDFDENNDYGYKNNKKKNKYTMIPQKRHYDFIFEDLKNTEINVVKSRDIYK